jgi:hypothetical protein
LKKTEIGDYGQPLWHAFWEALKGALAVSRTSDQLQHDRDYVISNGVKNIGGLRIAAWERLRHPTLNELSPGKIHVGTAMELSKDTAAIRNTRILVWANI